MLTILLESPSLSYHCLFVCLIHFGFCLLARPMLNLESIINMLRSPRPQLSPTIRLRGCWDLPFNYHPRKSYCNLAPRHSVSEIQTHLIWFGADRGNGVMDYWPCPHEGLKKQHFHALSMYWKMKTLLATVCTERQVDRYNVFASLEDVKWEQINQQFYMERMDACMAQMEHHIPCIATKSSPPWSSVKDP